MSTVVRGPRPLGGDENGREYWTTWMESRIRTVEQLPANQAEWIWALPGREYRGGPTPKPSVGRIVPIEASSGATIPSAPSAPAMAGAVVVPSPTSSAQYQQPAATVANGVAPMLAAADSLAREKATGPGSGLPGSVPEVQPMNHPSAQTTSRQGEALGDTFESLAAEASSLGHLPEIGKALARLSSYVPSFRSVLRGEPGVYVSVLGDRSELRDIVAWADHFASGWVGSIAAYLCDTVTSGRKSHPAAVETRQFFAELVNRFFIPLNQQFGVDIRVVIDEAVLDEKSMRVGKCVGDPRSKRVVGQLEVGFAVQGKLVRPSNVVIA